MASYEFISLETNTKMNMTGHEFVRSVGQDPLCFIYARQSTTRQNSLDEQKTVCLGFAQRNKYKYAVVFNDKASAWKKNAMNSLKSMNLMVRYIGKFHPGVVYVSDVSRFGRDVYTAISLLEKIQAHHINVESVMDNRRWSTNNMEKDDFTQSLLEARKFSTVLSERIQQRNRLTIASGGKLGNPRYGKMVIRVNGIRKFKKNPAENAIINKIKKWKADRKSSHTIAKLLNKNTTKRGKQWTKSLVSSVKIDDDDDDDDVDSSAMEMQSTGNADTPETISDSLWCLTL